MGGGPTRGWALAWLETNKDFCGNDCLIWPFAKDRHGYGQIRYEGKPQYVSRIICTHRHGPPPTLKHQTAHSCGNGHLGCVNGEHLRWATRAENEADKLMHGTHQLGERNPSAKLTEVDVAIIRKWHGTQREIARQYNIDQSTVSFIQNRKSWAWL